MLRVILTSSRTSARGENCLGREDLLEDPANSSVGMLPNLRGTGLASDSPMSSSSPADTPRPTPASSKTVTRGLNGQSSGAPSAMAGATLPPLPATGLVGEGRLGPTIILSGGLDGLPYGY